MNKQPMKNKKSSNPKEISASSPARKHVANDTVSTKKEVVKFKNKAKSKKKKLTPEEKEKVAYRADVRGIFLNAGFGRISGISDRPFNFLNIHKSDFDDVFVYENIVVLIEYTLTKPSNISDHLKPKTLIYNAILDNKKEFLEYFGKTFPTFAEAIGRDYHTNHVKIIVLYCSKNDVEPTLKAQVKNITYLDYSALEYFKVVTDAVKLSSKYELLKFLGLKFSDIGKNVFDATTSPKKMNGSILPESHSNFPEGYRVLSFYIDPETLLTNSYVLRKDGWMEEAGLYQRMIQKKKINSIRAYLVKKKRVFINNIIVTLPSDTLTLDPGKKNTPIHAKDLTKTTPIEIQIPNEFNVIGVIDGQHRVFAYHEGGQNDDDIKILRKRQNLLVTGIIYPEGISDTERSMFEANLFLEINTNQTTAKSELKQAIGVLLNPYDSESVAKAIIHRLNFNGALEGKIEKHFYEKGKIKPTSIVSYALKPLVKFKGDDSFFHLWDNVNKESLNNKSDDRILKDYIDFCTSQINVFLGAIKESVDHGAWTQEKPQGILSTNSINGFIICLRKLVQNNKTGDFRYYKSKLKDLKEVDFQGYVSSTYSALAEEIYTKCFGE